jgi:hypothetical protein
MRLHNNAAVCLTGWRLGWGSRNIAVATALMTMLAITGAAHAEDIESTDVPKWAFGGYGTLGAARSSQPFADYSGSVLNPGRAGYGRQWSPEVDSRLGAQIDATFNRRWSAVLQVLAEHRLDGSYRPQIEWANIQYKVTPDFSIRVGRIALPIFLTGDYRNVHYSSPWIRPPVEVYGALPVSSSDGIDASYRWNLGDLANTTQVSYGRTEVKLNDGGRAYGRAIAGLSNSSNYGAFNMRASIMTAEVSADTARPLFDAFRQFGAQGNDIANQYDVDHKRVLITSLGFNYDPGHWFLTGEIGSMNAHSYLGDKTVMYLGTGYRAGSLTPYISYGKSKSNAPISNAGLSPTGNPFVDGAAAVLNGQLNSVLRTVAVQHTVTMGVRWDFAANVALKVQYDRVRPQGGSTGTLINVQPGYQSGQTFSVVSAALDFVF